MTSPKGTWAWTSAGQIYIPEVQLRHISASQTTEVLRGSAFTLAVLSAGVCVGWILVEDAKKCRDQLCNPRAR